MTGRASLAGLTLGVLLAAAAAAPPSTPEDLVKDLASPAYAVREKATKALWDLGPKARPALEAAARSDDPEVAQRAKQILDKFDLGVFPDTPADVLAYIRAFRSGQLDKQKEAVAGLVALGEKGIPALRGLLSRPVPADDRPDRNRVDHRAALFEHLCVTLRREVPRLLLDGRHDRAEALLAVNALGPCSGGIMDYAAFLQLRGRTREAVAALEAAKAAGGPTGEAAAVALVYVHRAGHDAAKAKAAAKALTDTLAEPDADQSWALALGGPVSPRNLYDSLLEDLGDWAELADRDGPANSPDGLKIFRLRLAGRNKEADELTERQKDTANVASPRRYGIDPATMALFLNDRPLDGIDRLRDRLVAPYILADILTTRLRFPDALDLLAAGAKFDAATGIDPTQRALYGTRKGRLLAQLGQREAAAQVFAQLADQIPARDDGGDLLTQLVRAEVRSGRYDLACEHLGTALARIDPDNSRGAGIRQDGYELLFEADADSAAFWWRALRRARPADEPPGATMRRVRALLTGSATPDELDHTVRSVGKSIPSPGSYADETRAVAIAAAYRAAGQLDPAIAALAEAADRQEAGPVEDGDEEAYIRRYGRGSRAWVFGTDERFRFWMDLGDLLMEKGKYKDAAARYEQGWKRFPDNPILLYLSGRALSKAGAEAEGRKRVEVAHWAALGNARMRGRFLEELNSRGLLADARRERDLVRETGWVSEPYLGNVWNQVTRASVLLKEFDAAAASNRRAVHYVLRTPGWAYVEGYAYLTVPQAVKVQEARGLLAAGKVAEAVVKAKDCLAVVPGNHELVIPLVHELDRRGHTKEADELFRQVWGTFTKLAEQYPQSGWARYSAAWLAAGCRRELDAALDSAKKAVELDPDVKSHKECLAEVYFRRGDRAAAVGLMKELVRTDWRSRHYRRQLERYQTALLDSPLPDTDDD